MNKTIEACKEYMEFLSSEHYSVDKEENYENDIVETALREVYGDDVFNKIEELKEGNQ